MKLSVTYFIWFIVVPLHQWSLVGLAQNCLHAAGGDTVPTAYRDESSSPALPAGSQAVIDTYTFSCCGHVAQWRAYVTQNIRYNISFQVWRPSIAEAAGCYTLVGENIYTNIRSNGRMVELGAPSSNEIHFQEGDKVGYSINRIDGNSQGGGIQLEIRDSEYRNDMIWYFMSTTVVNGIASNCPFCRGEILATSTTAAPAISIELSTSSCRSTQQPVSTIPSSCMSIPTFSTSTMYMDVLSSPTTAIFSQTSTEEQFSQPVGTVQSLISSSSAKAQLTKITPVSSLLPLQPTPAVNSFNTFNFIESDTNNGGRSRNVYAVLGVIIAFVIMIATVTVVTMIVVIPRKKENMKVEEETLHYVKENPSYNIKSSTGLHDVLVYDTNVYQTIDDKETKKDNIDIVEPGQGVYSLYSPPEVPPLVPSPRLYSSIQEELSEYDKGKGYSVITTPQNLQPPGSDERKFDSSIYEYACTGSKLETLQYQTLESPGQVVPTQEERKSTAISTDEKLYKKLNFFENEPIYWKPASTAEALYEQLSFRKYREIPRKQVQILEQLGSGQVGIVSKAVWKVSEKTLSMAAKKLRRNTASTQRVKLLQEAAIMGQFHHPNVVKLYGLMTIGEPLTACLEYMKNGDLKEYLSSFDAERDFPPRDYKDIKYFLIQAATDVATGMKYLSSKSFVHRDLAARNIMLDDTMTCKIGDFGMARDLTDDTYYIMKDQRAIPLKWTAPEALFFKKYSTDSDVWSYGMLLFEIWSLGKDPFPSVGIRGLPELLKKGHCQPPPPGCPRAMFQLMIDCWNPIHSERPKFSEICNYLNQPISKLLYWSLQDDSISENVSKLGGNPEEGEQLYKDLQMKYIKDSNDIPQTYF